MSAAPLSSEEPTPTSRAGGGDSADSRADPATISHVDQHDASLRGSEAQAPPPAIPGYEIVDSGKAGGMGVVYKAYNPRLDVFVAIKTPHRRVLENAQSGARFINEARNAAQLRHPNICRILDVNEAAGLPYLVMEYIDGPNLAQWRTAGPRSFEACARMLAALCRAVHFAHEHNIIHRDIKPHNVLVRADDQPVLTDFGLAKSLSPRVEGEELTGAMQILGTLAYMAPEQTLGARQAGPLSDVYALGAVLYFLLTAEAPFQFQESEDLLGRLHRIRTEDPAWSAGKDPSTHSALEWICRKALAKNPAERYSSALALAEALEDYCEKKNRTEPPSAAPRRTARRWPALVAAAVALIGLSALLGVLAGWWRDPEAPIGGDRPMGPDLQLPPGAVRVMNGHTGNVFGVAFCPNGVHAVSGSADRTVRLWDLRSGQELHKFEGHQSDVYHVAVAPDGRLALSCSQDGMVILWDLHGRSKVKDLKGHKQAGRSVAFSPDGAKAVSGASDGLIVWDIVGGQGILQRLHGNNSGAMVARFFNDGRHILGAELLFPTLFVFDASTGEKLAEEKLPPKAANKVWFLRNIAISADDRYAAAAAAELVLWRVRHEGPGKITLQKLHHFTDEAQNYTSVEFAPSAGGASTGRLLSGSIEDRRACVWRWDERTGTPLDSHQHEERVWSVCFSRDGRDGLSGSGITRPEDGKNMPVDCTVRVWRVPEQK